MSNLFVLPKQVPLNSAGRVYPAAKLTFYRTGTSTPKAVYSDAAMMNPILQPVTADSGGTFQPIYLDVSDFEYRATLTTAADALIYTLDNVGGKLTQDEFNALLLGADAGMIGQILFPRTAAEIAANVTPADYGVPEGYAARYESIEDAFDVLQQGIGRLTLEPGQTYTINARLSLASLSNFVVDGNGATIFAANGMAVASGTQLLLLTTCSKFEIVNLTIDGNRDNRTPAETTAHLLQLSGCTKFALRRVSCPNAVCDGIRLDATNVADSATYCRDFLIENCYCDNAYRNGAGIINAWDGIVDGGAYTNSNGTAPECGLDVESNDNSVDPGNRSIRVRGARFTGNQGVGLTFSSKDASYAMVADHCYFSDCDLGGMIAGAQTTVIACEFDGFSAAGAMGIDVSSSTNAKLKVIGSWFRNFGALAGPCIDDGSSSAEVEVLGSEFKDVVKAVTSDGTILIFSHNVVDTTSGIAVSFGTGTKATITANRIKAATGRAIFGTGTYATITGNHLIDVGSVSVAYLQADGAGNFIANNICEASTAQATTLGIRAHVDAAAVIFNRFVNLHTTQPIGFTGTRGATSALCGWNTGGTDNNSNVSLFAIAPPSRTNANRGSASDFAAGSQIWNTDDGFPNYASGANWVTAAGAIT